MQRASQRVLIGLGQPNVGHAHTAPATGDGQEHIRPFTNEVCLLIERQHEIAVTQALRGKRGKYAATHTEVRRTHVGTFFSARDAQSDATKISNGHGSDERTGRPKGPPENPHLRKGL